MTPVAGTYGTARWPTEVRLKKAEKVVEIDYDDGATFRFPAEFLRVESPSAEVKGHGHGQQRLVAGRRHVGILELEAVGNYAVRIVFDDLHDTGIYSWEYLYDLGVNQEKLWREYVAALAASGKTRDP